MKILHLIWYNERYRGLLYQIVLLGLIVWGAYTLYSYASINLEKQNIASGFNYLAHRSGFDIGEIPIEYDSDDTYFKALLVGAINTVNVAFVGILLSVFIGLIVGIMRLSSNWLLSKIAYSYTEIARNTPLLLQLFFIYGIFLVIFPRVNEVQPTLWHIYLSNRGIYFPTMDSHFVWDYFGVIVICGVLTAYAIKQAIKKYQERTGRFIASGYMFALFPVMYLFLVWLFGGLPTDYTVPILQGRNFVGGGSYSPEFLSLLLGLVFHTSAYVAEVIRSGIQSVGRGQVEAAKAIGLTSGQTMPLVVLPQAMRVIIPPLTNQMLNLIKNSSLAVSVGYPDFVSVANTTINQTGQAIEGVATIMLLYLFFSITTSIFMNWFNKKVKLVER